MTLILEDGTGVVAADSYSSLLELDTYSASFGITSWQGLAEEQKEVLARKGSQYLDMRYGYSLSGSPVNPLQGLAFPRTDLRLHQADFPLESVFGLVKKAAIISSMLLADGHDLLPKKGGDANVIAKKLANGAIETQWDKDSFGVLPVFREIESVLFPIFGLMPDDVSMAEQLYTVPIERV